MQIAFAALCVACGGFTKGIVGLGLPLVAVPLLSFFMPVPQAISVLILPILATNVYQALRSGKILEALRRFWPVILFLAIGIPIGTFGLTSLNRSYLDFALGTIVIVFALANLVPGAFTIRPQHERWLAPVFGIGAGIIGGISGQYGVPIGVYLLAIKVSKETFIATMAVALGLGGIALLVSFASFGVLRAHELLYSAVATVPALAGIAIGERLRDRLSQETFRKAVLLVLIISGVVLIRRALHG